MYRFLAYRLPVDRDMEYITIHDQLLVHEICVVYDHILGWTIYQELDGNGHVMDCMEVTVLVVLHMKVFVVMEKYELG